MVTQFDEKDVGCVHQIPIWKNRDTIEHSVNMAYFSCHHSRFYLFSDAVGILCVSGMSMMLDKEKLNEIGKALNIIQVE
ncbi:hypothetical protein HZS_2892 [Henneguya salminicola]|nr:hypothetical protein HZS_2892 [Henneguya salminicola]